MPGTDEPDPDGPAGDGGATDEGGDGRVKVWARWTDDGEVPFHEYCELWPETLPPVLGRGEAYPEGEPPPLSYVPPLARWALRHTPFLVLVATVAYAVIEFGGSAVRALGDVYAVGPAPATWLGVLLILAWLAALALIVRAVFRIDGSSSVQSVAVYGLLAVLTAGLVLDMYLAIAGPAPLPAGLAEAVQSFPFPFLWMLFVGGHLVYDGMLRTENMFDRLDEKNPSIIAEDSDYPGFLRHLKADLDHETPLAERLPSGLRSVPPLSWLPDRVETAYLFSAVFVAPFFLVWWLLPTGPDRIANVALRGVASLLPAILDFFLVVVFFQFLVLVAYFNRLLTGRGSMRADGGEVRLVYTPNHHDEYAGFGDFGRFATRVNVLLVVGGIYVVNHLHGGVRAYPGFADGVTLDLLGWAMSSFLPLATYVLAVVVWFYLSFWGIHKAMRRGRQRELEACARRSEEPDPALRNGPVWPVDGQLLVSNVSLDLVPLLTFLPFFRL